MKFKRDDEVVVKTHTGTSLGVILEDIELKNEVFWWVSYQVNGEAKIAPFPEKDLSEWNGNSHICTCGAASVKSDRHSYHCEKETLA